METIRRGGVRRLFARWRRRVSGGPQRKDSGGCGRAEAWGADEASAAIQGL